MERLPPHLPLMVAGERVEGDVQTRLPHVGHRFLGGRQTWVVGAYRDIEQFQRLVVFLVL